jgi:hypothetical protein
MRRRRRAGCCYILSQLRKTVADLARKTARTVKPAKALPKSPASGVAGKSFYPAVLTVSDRPVQRTVLSEIPKNAGAFFAKNNIGTHLPPGVRLG